MTHEQKNIELIPTDCPEWFAEAVEVPEELFCVLAWLPVGMTNAGKWIGLYREEWEAQIRVAQLEREDYTEVDVTPCSVTSCLEECRRDNRPGVQIKTWIGGEWVVVREYSA